MKSNTFSIVLGIIFGLAAIVALLLFAGIIKLPSSSTQTQKPSVLVWGVLDSSYVNPLIKNYNDDTNSQVKIIYQQIDPNKDLYLSFIKSIADGDSPDVILVHQNEFYQLRNRLFTIPFLWNSETSFRSTYVDYASAFLSSSGIRALPIAIDPMVLYYNRDILSDAGYSDPIKTWDELYVQYNDVVKKDRVLGISRSLISFGSFSNIIHAKEILALLLIQSGNTIATLSDQNVLSFSLDNKDTSTVIQFFNQFSNPLGDYYTWNSKMSDSRSVFLSGDMLYYIGFASELFELRDRNPNLNYGIVMIPQIKDTPKQATYGNFIVGAITNTSKNQGAAYTALSLFAGRDFVEQITSNTGLVSARRDLLVMPEKVSYGEIFQKSGLIARGWFDPKKEETGQVFQELINNTISGRLRIDESISRAQSALQSITSLINQ